MCSTSSTVWTATRAECVAYMYGDSSTYDRVVTPHLVQTSGPLVFLEGWPQSCAVHLQPASDENNLSSVRMRMLGTTYLCAQYCVCSMARMPSLRRAVASAQCVRCHMCLQKMVLRRLTRCARGIQRLQACHPRHVCWRGDIAHAWSIRPAPRCAGARPLTYSGGLHPPI